MNIGIYDKCPQGILLDLFQDVPYNISPDFELCRSVVILECLPVDQIVIAHLLVRTLLESRHRALRTLSFLKASNEILWTFLANRLTSEYRAV